MTDDKRCFIDTNVLLASTDTSRSDHSEALAFLQAGMVGEQRLFASGQILREYLVVSTRPTQANGLGLTSSEALENIREFQSCVQLLDENADVAEQLLALVHTHGLKGKRIHDANIAATMRAHGLARIRTANTGDFAPFEGIETETLAP
jgi:predicted nucleic acid-binding protein